MSEKMQEQKKKEADACLKEGDKITTKSFTRWKADWDNGAIQYEKAAKAYRAIKQYEQAKYCFKRLSICQTNMDVYYLAAKSIEQAATCAKELNQIDETADLYIEAAKLYRTNGNSFAAADIMTRAARMLEEKDLTRSLKLLGDACDLFELDDKEHFSGDTFKTTISMLMRHKKYFDCIDLLLAQNRVLLKLDQSHELHKSCLGIIVLHLKLDDVVSAKKKYEDFIVYVSFAHSTEGSTAAELIQAFDRNDSAALKAITSRSILNYLDNEIAKVAKALTIGKETSGGVKAEEEEDKESVF